MSVTKGTDPTNSWSPMHYVGIWTDCSRTNCVTVVILLPSGINNEEIEDIVATVSEDRKFLLLTATWPEPFSNVQGMHDIWNINEFGPQEARDFQRRQISLETTIDEMKDYRRDRLKSTSSIELPFVVKNAVSAFVLREDGDVNILYVTLKEDKNSNFDYQAVVTLKRKGGDGGGDGSRSLKRPPVAC